MAGNQQTQTEQKKREREFNSEDSVSDTKDPDADSEEPDSDSEPPQNNANSAQRFLSKKAILVALDSIVYATCVSLRKSKLREEMKNNITTDVGNTISKLPFVHQCSDAEIKQLSELRLVAMAEEVLVNLRYLCEFNLRAEAEAEAEAEVEMELSVDSSRDGAFLSATPSPPAQLHLPLNDR